MAGIRVSFLRFISYQFDGGRDFSQHIRVAAVIAYRIFQHKSMESFLEKGQGHRFAFKRREKSKSSAGQNDDSGTPVFFEYYCAQLVYVERLMCHPSYSCYCARPHEKAIVENQKRYNPNQNRPVAEQNLICPL